MAKLRVAASVLVADDWSDQCSIRLLAFAAEVLETPITPLGDRSWPDDCRAAARFSSQP
jgi:hypothetical protein